VVEVMSAAARRTDIKIPPDTIVQWIRLAEAARLLPWS
jgi:hypothetical protein